MERTTRWTLLALAILTPTAGCRSRATFFDDAQRYQPFVQQVEYPDVEDACRAVPAPTAPPPSVRRPSELADWPLTLEDAAAIALSNSQVIREVGGLVVSAPAASRTVFDPAIAESSPLVGTAAALAEFDAQFRTSLQLGHDEQTFNNVYYGGGSFGVVNRTGAFRSGITKTAPTGTQFSLENTTNYLRNGLPSNRFPSVYDTIFRGGFRHPLLQGSGIEFNRIAGPHAAPGAYNGIVLARINSDIALADFEAAVQDLLRDVERTYWELYFAYRNLDALVRGRNYALGDWRLAKARFEEGDATSDVPALALQGYYGAEVLVENALSGSPDGRSGVYGLERELRYLLGLPSSDGRLIRPVTRPANIDFVFDWNESLTMAHSRRVELRRQRWRVKQRELELVASRSYERMRLDLVGQYYFRGFGDDLFGGGGGENRSAFKDLLDGNLQGWLCGVELNTPVGNRIGHAAVRHAELQLHREKAILDEQARRISHDLNGAFVELDRSFRVAQTSFNRWIAADDQRKVLVAKYDVGKERLDFVLDAQRRAVEAEIQHHRAITDYNIALASLNFARGTLLDTMQVHLAEGPWPLEAYESAAKQSRRFRETPPDRCRTIPSPVSRGAYPQHAEQGTAGVPPQSAPAAGSAENPQLPEPRSPLVPPHDPANQPFSPFPPAAAAEDAPPPRAPDAFFHGPLFPLLPPVQDPAVLAR